LRGITRRDIPGYSTDMIKAGSAMVIFDGSCRVIFFSGVIGVVED